jgi:acetyltransferase-like isoleucine patch superfamily enzyme
MPFETVVVPHVNVNDLEVILVEWLIAPWQPVEKGIPLCIVETTKAVITVESPGNGFIYPVAAVGKSVPVGQPLAHIFPTDSAVQVSELTASAGMESTVTVTKKARELMDKFNLTEADFPAYSAVSRDTVVAKLRERQSYAGLASSDVPDSIRPDSNSIVLIGDANMALLALDAIEASGEMTAIAFLSEGAPGGWFYGLPTFGLDALKELAARGLKNAFFYMPTPAQTQRAAEEAAALGIAAPAIIHPTAAVSNRCKIGRGIFIGALAAVGPDVELEDFSRVLCGASVAHHSRIGRFASISDGARLGGNVEVGDEALVGISAAVCKRVRIGKRAIIVTGATVDDNVDDGHVLRLDGSSQPVPHGTHREDASG